MNTLVQRVIKSRIARSTACALVLAPCAALAGVAQLQMEGGVMSQLEYDAHAVRMTQKGSYVLSSPQGVWFVMADGAGQPMVMDMAQMQRFMGGRMSAGLGGVQGTSNLRDTGRDETVAGIRGDVYLVRYTDERGRPQETEAVLSSDARAQALSAAFMQMSSAMARSLGQPDSARSFSAMLDRAGKGVLRFGDVLQVVNVSDQRVAADRLRLPANAQAMPGAGGAAYPGDLFSGETAYPGDLFSGASAGDGAEPASSGGLGTRLGGLLGDQVKRQQGRVEGRTEAEIEAEADEATDQLLDKALNKLFGG